MPQSPSIARVRRSDGVRNHAGRGEREFDVPRVVFRENFCSSAYTPGDGLSSLTGLLALLILLLGSSLVDADDASPQTFRGQTMGTTYMVKVFDPPQWKSDPGVAIDAELRSVNDQMSTYLETSEISRFNDSESTDWFDVSADTAGVVTQSLQISEATSGAFDVTVGPLVDRWSFGPGDRKYDVPSDEELKVLSERIGYQYLEVRLEPPALRKSIANLRVDLSSIAKGHGVDRVVEMLLDQNARNVFVEIGGEVRTTGRKGSQPWTVGVVRPDAIGDTVLVATELTDAAMATSGDYRNFFKADGKRYAHTIDPVTLRPVTHRLASVSVMAKDCVTADGWATALTVMGPEKAEAIASSQGLEILLVERTDSEITSELVMKGTGMFAQFSTNVIAAASDAVAASSFSERFVPVLVVTAAVFFAVVIAMAVGVMFGRRSISGSCGGLNAKTDPDGVSRCSLCSSPSEACQELRDRMQS